jgi:hypothetical protein
MNNKLEHIAIKYLNKMYGDLEEYKREDFTDSLFFIKDKKVYMEQNFHKLWIDYDTIWSDLENIFLLENDEIKSIITKWVKETYKLKNVTPQLSHLSILF